MKPQVVFVLGGPGAGKGTQCSNIVEVGEMEMKSCITRIYHVVVKVLTCEFQLAVGFLCVFLWSKVLKSLTSGCPLKRQCVSQPAS